MEDFLWQCGVDPHAPTAASTKASGKESQTSQRQGEDVDSDGAPTSPGAPTSGPMSPTKAVAAAAEAAATAAAAAAKISACFYTNPLRSTPEVPMSGLERRSPSSQDLDAIDAQIKAMIGKAGNGSSDGQKENRHSNYVATNGGA